MALIDSVSVHNLFVSCLTDDKDETAVIAEMLACKVYMSKDKVEAAREQITKDLLNLHPNFIRATGGGWTFINACLDRNGDLWTNCHRDMDELVTMGVMIGKVIMLFPRNHWDSLPGGVPYFVVAAD